MRSKRTARGGLTLVEILIASIILAVAGTAVLGIYSTTTRGIRTTDLKREERMYLQEILAHVNRQSLHELWNHFGPAGFGPNRPLNGSMALMDSNGQLVNTGDPLRSNPLGFTQGFLDEMRKNKLKARIDFEFYTRNELGVSDAAPVNGTIGLLHMQAGYVSIYLYNLGDNDDPGNPPPAPVHPPGKNYVAAWRQPIMCPAIVGRPGLKLSSCPALDPRTKCRYGPHLAAKEGYEWTTQQQNRCQNLGVTPI